MKKKTRPVEYDAFTSFYTFSHSIRTLSGNVALEFLVGRYWGASHFTPFLNYTSEDLYQRRFKMGRSRGASFQIVTGI